MHSFKTIVIAALSAISLVSVWQYSVRHSRAQEGARLRTENEHLRREVDQRRARSVSATQLDLSAPGSVTQRSDSRDLSSPSASAVPRVPEGNYRNEGQATPLSALQTLAWASDHADATWVEKLIVFEPLARTKSASYFASLPPKIRVQWPTIEVMAAALLISEGIESPYPTAAILQQAGVESIEADRVALVMPDTSRPRMEFLHTPEGWKYVITEAMVDEYLNDVAQRARGSEQP